jgi:hypothetical protein
MNDHARRITRLCATAASTFSLLVALPSLAHAQQCQCASDACDALMTATHRDHAQCASLRNVPAQSCQSASAGMVQALRSMGQSLPASCGPTAPTGGPAAPTPPGDNGPAVPPPSGPMSNNPESPEPTPLPADPPTTSHSPSGRLACVMDRDGHRVLLTGHVERFTIRCSGIPLAGNPTGAGNPAPPPQRTGDGRTVQIHWNPPPGGGLDPLFAAAAYTAPAQQPHPAEVRIAATVTIPAGHGQPAESVTVSRTVHVVPQRMRLEFDSHQVTHCQPLSPHQGTLTMGFSLTCHMGIDLHVADDFTVSGSGGSSCGAGQATSIQPCAPGISSGEAEGGWSFDSANGHIDPESGVMDLHVNGNRVGYLTVHFSNGRTDRAHTTPLFPRPFTMMPDDGTTRSFGSLTTNSSAGMTNTFTLRAQ